MRHSKRDILLLKAQILIYSGTPSNQRRPCPRPNQPTEGAIKRHQSMSQTKVATASNTK